MSYVITSRGRAAQYPPRSTVARFNARSSLSRGLVGMWAGFDLPYSSTIRDVTGRGNDATITKANQGPRAEIAAISQSRASVVNASSGTPDGPIGIATIPEFELGASSNKATLMIWFRRRATSKYSGIGYGSSGTVRLHLAPWISSALYIALNGAFWSTTLNTTNWYHGAIVFDGTLVASNRTKLYLDGAFVTNGSASAGANMTANSGNRIRLGHPVGGLSSGTNSAWFDARAYNVALSAEEIAHAYAPQTRFDTYAADVRRTYFIPEAAGGSTFNETLSESLSFTDTDSETAAFARSLTESLLLIDASNESAILNSSLTEALVLADTATEVATFVQSLTEALALDDTTSGLTGVFLTLVESLAFADTASESAVFTQQIIEALGLSDASQISTKTLLLALVEGLVFADSATGEGGEQVAGARGGRSMTLRQMRELERKQLLEMIRQDDDVIISLLAGILRNGNRRN